MAIYSASLKTISRKAGRSATAAAAYRTGTLVEDERTGDTHDYTRKEGVAHVSRHFPHGLSMDTKEIWNKAEAAEKRKDATVARELVVALPHELTQYQRNALAESIAMELVGRYQVAAESSVHLPNKSETVDGEMDNKNDHVHIQFSTRRMTEDGSFGAKTRELDDIKQGKIEVEWIRQMVEEKTNLALEAAGLDVRVDRRSLKDQRAAALESGNLELAQELDRAPQIHQGPRVTEILREASREGREPLGALDRAAANDDLNFDIDAGRVDLAEVISMIEHLEKRDAERTAAHVEAIQENDLRDRLSAAVAQRDNVEMKKINLGIKLSQGKPGYIYEDRAQRKEMVAAKKEAAAWRKEHKWFAKTADMVGIKLETDKAAEYAIAKYDTSPERAKAEAWIAKYDAADLRHQKLGDKLEKCEAQVSRLSEEVAALNRPDPEQTEQIKTEVAQAVESARPEIAAFVDKHRPQIEAAAEIGAGIEAWISMDIISTGNPAIDELSRKGAQFRSRMLREEMQRAEEHERIAGQATKKYMAAFKKGFDSAFRSAAREAEPQIDQTEARRLAAEAAAAALRAQKPAPAEYVPTWKRGRHDDSDLKYEP